MLDDHVRFCQSGWNPGSSGLALLVGPCDPCLVAPSASDHSPLAPVPHLLGRAAERQSLARGPGHAFADWAATQAAHWTKPLGWKPVLEQEWSEIGLPPGDFLNMVFECFRIKAYLHISSQNLASFREVELCRSGCCKGNFCSFGTELLWADPLGEA